MSVITFTLFVAENGARLLYWHSSDSVWQREFAFNALAESVSTILNSNWIEFVMITFNFQFDFFIHIMSAHFLFLYYVTCMRSVWYQRLAITEVIVETGLHQRPVREKKKKQKHWLRCFFFFQIEFTTYQRAAPSYALHWQLVREISNEMGMHKRMEN